MFILIVFYREYLVTCTSKTAATLTKTTTVIIEFPVCLNTTSTMSTNNTTSNTSECEKSTEHTASISFTDSDGLLPLTLYECVIQLTVNNYMSAKSVHTLLNTNIKSDGKLMCFGYCTYCIQL